MVLSGANFADVTRIDRWRPFFQLGSGYPKGLVLNYTRDAEGSWTSWNARIQWPEGVPATLLDPSMLGERNLYVGRDAMIVVLPEEIAVDQQSIQAAVQGMVRACAE